MLLHWPQNHLEEQHLTHWISLGSRDESFLKATLELIELWTGLWLSEEEASQLKTLLKRDEVDLVYRYLDLQWSYRNAKDKDVLHDSIELEKQLDQYLKYPQKNHFLLEIGIRCIQHTLYSWFESLQIELPEEFKNLKEADLGKKIERILRGILKEQSLNLPIKERLFLEEFLKELQKNQNDLEYLNRFCSSLEQLLSWEKTLLEIGSELESLVSKKSVSAPDLTSLDNFEKQLKSFLTQLGKFLLSAIFPAFTETQQAICIGKLRKLFQQINDLYGKYKTERLGADAGVHISCLCHFSAHLDEKVWPINNHVIQSKNLPPLTLNQPTKSLLIFTCGGGRGHLSTAKAMAEYAASSYHILAANTLEDTLASTDFFKKFLLDFSHEKLYNHLLKHEEFEWLKLITSVGPFFIMMQQENIEKLIRREVLKQNPDMIISCFPVMNAMFLNVAKELNLPLLIVTTDLDTSLFIKGMNSSNCDLQYPHYRITLAYEDPEMRKILEKKIPPEKIHISGFPIRPPFKKKLSVLDKKTLRNSLSISEEEAVLLVMMGGNAGLAIEKYAEILASYSDEELDLLGIGKKFSAILLCGDQKNQENQLMFERIKQMQTSSKKMKLVPLGFTEEVVDFCFG